MSNDMDNSCATLVPTVMPRFPGDWQIRLVTFSWLTDTPLGVPVLPEYCQPCMEMCSSTDLPDV